MNARIKIVIFLSTIILTSCGKKIYNNKYFLSENSIEGKTVAILPVEVILSGKLPKGMTEQRRFNEERSESKLLQDIFYSEYLEKSKSYNKKKHAVEFLNPSLVNSKLLTASISADQLSEIEPQRLSNVTGADMIFLVRVKKNRFMSDGVALGVDVAGSILNSVLNPTGNNNANVSSTKTYDISFNATLIDGTTGTTITQFSELREATWKDNPEMVIRNNYSRLIRKGAIYIQN